MQSYLTQNGTEKHGFFIVYPPKAYSVQITDNPKEPIFRRSGFNPDKAAEMLVLRTGGFGVEYEARERERIVPIFTVGVHQVYTVEIEAQSFNDAVSAAQFVSIVDSSWE